MIRFIHTADIHLDSPLHRLEVYEGAPVDEIRNASRRAFENLIELALVETVDFVLIAGDLFDGEWKDYNTGLFFVNQVRRLNDGHIPVFMVSGNHDAASQVTKSLPYPENVTLFSHKKPETRILESVGVAIHGQSFATPAITDNLSIGYPDPITAYFNIGLLHTSVTGREGHESYAPCTVHDLANKGYDYWALGHVHQYEIVGDEPPVVFPGCIQGRHIRETGSKGCVMVTVEDGTAPRVDNQSLDVVRWEHLEIDTYLCTTENQCLDRFQETLEETVKTHSPLPVVARVTFTGQTDMHKRLSADPEHWKEIVRSVALTIAGEHVWIEKVKILTRPRGQTPSPDPDSGPSLALDQYLEALRSDTTGLLSLGDSLSDLIRKLPSELRENGQSLRPDDPEYIRNLLDQSHAMLIQRLRETSSK